VAGVAQSVSGSKTPLRRRLAVSFEEYPEAFLWRCDKCGYEVAFKPHDFYACVAELKA